MAPVTIKHLILERLSELGEIAFDNFFPSKYPQARMWRNLLGKPQRKFSRRSFSVILSQLRAQGLVERNGTPRNSRWKISRAGTTYLQKQSSAILKPDGIQRLVIFDIPEKMKAKRNAVRYELVSCGYHQLQKSVWMGATPLPNDFISMLDALALKSHVHIFSVRDTGTLSIQS